MAKANDKKAAPAKAAKAPAKAAAPAAAKAAPMSRSDVVDIVAAQTGLTRSQAESAVKSYESAVQRTLSTGGEVRLGGFGSYKTSYRAARTGRNPQTGESVPVAARTVVRFVPSAALKSAVSGDSGKGKAAKAAKAPAKAGKAAKAAKAPAKAAKKGKK